MASKLEMDNDKEQSEYLAISLSFLVLVISQLIVYVMRKFPAILIPETGMLILFGMCVGGLIRLFDNPGNHLVHSIDKIVSFDETLFFAVLLPPIIFHSGYAINKPAFMSNIGAIGLLSVVGTLSIAICTGGLMFMFSSFSGVYSTNLVESMAFGALISATDPVSVLATFNRVGVKPKLAILVFGESLLNDAMAIVLFRSILTYEDDMLDDSKDFSAFGSVLEFLRIFFGSIAVGVFVGFSSALLFKNVELWVKDMRQLETALTITLPYLSYAIAAGLELSGIVSLLFCGMFMSSYTRLNLSIESEKFLRDFYEALAYLAETFIFIYLGMATLTGDGDWSSEAIWFGVCGFFACLVARLLVVPLCMVVNLTRNSRQQISRSEMFVLWYAGLRGGMAYALATASPNELASESTGRVFESASSIIIFFTVFICGSTIEHIVRKFDLVDSELQDSADNNYSFNTQVDPSNPVNHSGIELGHVLKKPSLWSKFENRVVRPVCVRNESEGSRVQQGSLDEGPEIEGDLSAI